jgi:hypothetical protein
VAAPIPKAISKKITKRDNTRLAITFMRDYSGTMGIEDHRG